MPHADNPMALKRSPLPAHLREHRSQWSLDGESQSMLHRAPEHVPVRWKSPDAFAAAAHGSPHAREHRQNAQRGERVAGGRPGAHPRGAHF